MFALDVFKRYVSKVLAYAHIVVCAWAHVPLIVQQWFNDMLCHVTRLWDVQWQGVIFSVDLSDKLHDAHLDFGDTLADSIHIASCIMASKLLAAL